MDENFLGAGWSFPVGINARGRIDLARGATDIEQAIRIIVQTPRGQRVMRPNFGCQIHDLIFAPNDATTCGLAAIYVEDALRMWEPRIEVKSVNAQPDVDETGGSRLLVEVQYEIKATHDRRSLVFPFYRIPGE